MRDVAELAGVGTMTVSRVLSGAVPVSDQTRERVERAIKALNYRPNEVARSLRESRTRSIGIIVPNFDDVFFSACAQEVSMVAKEHAYSFMVTTSEEDPETEYAEASLMLGRHMEGLIVIPAAGGKSRLNAPEFRSLPIVALDRPLPGAQFSTVLVENKRGAELGIEHLIGHGHTRIFFLALTDQLFTLNARRDGYVQAMKRAGLVPEVFSNCSTQAATLELLRAQKEAGILPTAIFVSNYMVMRYTLHALNTLGIAIPQQIAIAGFDDFDMADIFNPAITVVRQPLHEVGRAAAEMLFEQLLHQDPDAKTQRRVLPVELVIRRSCGCNP
jgi:LacI family transcriptional regulator